MLKQIIGLLKNKQIMRWSSVYTKY